MNGNTIITIGRECGSEGRVIGQLLAEKLGVKCYDKELLTLAAKKSGMCEEVFQMHDEKPTKSFLYSLVSENYGLGYASGYLDMPLNHKVFLAQFDTIKHLAETESCVIVGRCADYALAGDPDTISIFITADMEDKIEYICKAYDKTPDKAEDVIRKNDKQRSSYYNYFTNKKWGDARGYDLCINSSVLGVEGTVDMIYHFLKARSKKQDA